MGWPRRPLLRRYAADLTPTADPTPLIDKAADGLARKPPPATTRGSGEWLVSQRVTAADLKAGRIRLPRGTKRLFPAERTDVQMVLRGTRLTARYNPRLGPDQERSAVLGIGKAMLTRLVLKDEVLRVSRGPNGIVKLD